MSSCEPSDAQSIRAHSIRVILIGPIYIRSFLIWLLDLPAGNLNRSDQNKSELPFFYFKFPNVWNYSNAMTALCVCFASDVRRMLAALSTAKHFPFFSARTFAFLITLSKSAGRTRSLWWLKSRMQGTWKALASWKCDWQYHRGLPRIKELTCFVTSPGST